MSDARPLPPGIVAVGAAVTAARRRSGKRSRGDYRVKTDASGKARIEYDVTDAPDVDSVAPPYELDLPPEPEPEAHEPGSFGHRVLAKKRGLVRVLLTGVPEVQFLPASDGMLVQGKRHHLAAPRKTGKSLAMQSHWVDMIDAGSGGVVILDRENGAEEYARRLGAILEAKGYANEELERIEQRLHYFEFPHFRGEDGREFAEAMQDLGVDIVVFDSQRMFLTDLGLKEDAADDYARFMHNVIDPLFEAGIATLVLDNTGHKEQDRGRGSVAKGDLNEVLFKMASVRDFDRFQKGQVKLSVTASRFGTGGEWTMELGGGTFGSWTVDRVDEHAEFRREAQAVLADAGRPMGVDAIASAVRERGVKIGQGKARALLLRYAEDPKLPIRKDGTRGFTVEDEA